MKKYTVAVLVGSLRKESYNKKVAKSLIELAPENVSLEIIELGNLPLYNEDLESNTPETWTQFRKKIESSDAVLFVTPEYNRSTTAIIKNALDVASRPWGKNVWNNKPGAVISVSMSAMGGFGANHHIRQSATFLNIPMMQQPEAYIGSVQTLYNDEGLLINKESEKFLKNFIEAFGKWIERISA